MVKENKHLGLLYQAFNAWLFKGKLPSIPVFKGPGSREYYGFYIYNKKTRAPLCIALNNHIPMGMVLHVLIHEMTHCYVHWILKDKSRMEHSPTFVRVAKRAYRHVGIEPYSGEFDND